MEKCIHVHHQLLDFAHPRVMAIINFSPDSFYTSCDVSREADILSHVEEVLRSGADILDLGACSTRPGSTPVDAATEWQLLSEGLGMIRHHWHDVPISVDTFRTDIAERAIAMGADMINDVSGANADPRMWELAAKRHVPYVLTHAQSVVEPAMVDVVDARDARVVLAVLVVLLLEHALEDALEDVLVAPVALLLEHALVTAPVDVKTVVKIIVILDVAVVLWQ